MPRVRFIMVGGFLGAGKTTVIGRLAQSYVARGARVGIITNDQSSNLVDTHTFRALGFPVEEVPGSCFCCAFNELERALGRLEGQQRPDVLLAEPVGSCTDLVATVVQPIKRLYRDRYVPTPLVVLVDPHRAVKILSRTARGGFSPKAAYIYEKQLQEADAIAVNKVDALATAQQNEVIGLVREKFPQKPVVPLSGRTGEGLEQLQELLDQEGNFGRNIPDVNYDIYAEGEAELGWLNSTTRLSAPDLFDLDQLLRELMQRIQHALEQTGAETAHLKIVLQADGKQAVANLVRSDAQPELSIESRHKFREAELIVNARAFLDPAQLSHLVEDCLSTQCAASGMRYRVKTNQHFRPARPVPTYRYTDA